VQQPIVNNIEEHTRLFWDMVLILWLTNHENYLHFIPFTLTP
jgi:hypothetical protein